MSIRVKLVVTPLASLLAALLVSGCSSRNPDSLVGMNLDENLAMMDANASSEANAAPTAASDSNAAPAHASSDHAAQPAPSATSNADEQHSATANATETENPPEDQTTANQVENEDEPPNGI
jgi:hypothetical protein